MKALLFSLWFVGCSGEEAGKSTEKTKGSTTFNDLNDPEALAKAVDKSKLVPSPIEMQKQLREAKLQTTLAELIPTEKVIEVVVDKDNDQTAIRTGIVLADLVLSLEVSSNEQTLERLAALKKGFKKLGAGSDITATIEMMESSIKDGSSKKSELLQEFDLYSKVMVPELEHEAGAWVVPLVQAGTWLEGANLVAKIMIKEGKYDSADTFFRQKAIVEYFISYVDREGKDKIPGGVLDKVSKKMATLKSIAGKSKIEEADVKKIKDITSEILGLLR